MLAGHTQQSLNNTLVQLRKNCNHPDILTASSEQTPEFPPADTIVEQAGKFKLLERLLKRLKAGGHKVLIFSQVRLHILSHFAAIVRFTRSLLVVHPLHTPLC